MVFFVVVDQTLVIVFLLLIYLLSSTFYNAATSNGSRLVWVGNTGITNTMEYVTIATQGNSIDWGDQGGTVQHSGGAASDSHGGLS